MTSSMLVYNARIRTMQSARPEAEALLIRDGVFAAVGSNAEVLPLAGRDTLRIDAQGKRVIPGLNDSHLHLIRGGLNFNLELRWDALPSLADAMALLRQQAQRTPPPQWVRVVGGFNEFQFAERRLPTIEEVNAATGDVPCFILHLYDRAILNRAALRAVGYDKNTPDPPGAEIQRDKYGNPTGLLIARPNASILYSTLAKGPRLPYDDQMNSTRHFMREMNRLGLTSAIDAGGGFQNYPDDYAVVQDLARRNELSVRLAYNLFTQRPKQELDDFRKWTAAHRAGEGTAWFRLNGAGEMLVFSAADFEDFLEPRPQLLSSLEGELELVIRHLVANRWPFRLHATYEESIQRFLNVFEAVNRDIPFSGLHWFLDHAETISDASLERVAALQGGIAVQHRMAYQGEYFVQRYGAIAAQRTPPVRRMLEMGLPVGAGTDATRVASYNPWVCLHWLHTGRTVGGLELYPPQNCLTRDEALQLYTRGSSWFSSEEDRKGAIATGQLGDFVILSRDFFSVPADEIPAIESELTVVGGKVVFAAGDFASWNPPLPPPSPAWSPVAHRGAAHAPAPAKAHHHQCAHHAGSDELLPEGLFCPCFAF